MSNSISYNSEMYGLLLDLNQMFEVSDLEEVPSAPPQKSPSVQEMDSASIDSFSEPALMQRIWGGETHLISDGFFDRSEENLKDNRTSEALRIIQQRFSLGNSTPLASENSDFLQNRVRIVQLEEGIKKTKELIKQKEAAIDQELIDTRSITESSSTISTDEKALSPRRPPESLAQHQSEQASVMKLSDEALRMSEQDFVAFDEQQCELEELSIEIESVKEELSDCNKELGVINQLIIEKNQAKERKRREEIALQEQVETLTTTFADIRVEQEDIYTEINELTDRQSEVEQQYEDLKSQQDLEYPHLHTTINLSNQLSTISSHVNTQVQAIPGYVRAASIFLWENFTHIAWKTIELISNLGKAIFQMTAKVCSYVIQKGEEFVSGWISTPVLIASATISLLILQKTGSPIAFGAIAVSGYLLLRKLY